MSPGSQAARPIWLWSLPAFAVILSFLWYRKKRSSLKIPDSGGVAEDTLEDPVEPVISPDQVLKSSPETISDTESDSLPDPVIESAVIAKTVEYIESIPQKELLVEEEVQKYLVQEEKQEEEQKYLIQEEKQEEVKEHCCNHIQEEVEVQVEEQLKEEVDTEQKDNHIVEEEPVVVKVPVESSGRIGSRGKSGKSKKYKKMAKKMNNETSVDQRQKKDSSSNNTACILEQKLAELNLSADDCNEDDVVKKPMNEDVAERDSANNSPSEVMLASPSVSGYSDTHSEGSSDSGKGCSEMLTPSRTPASGNSVSGDLPQMSLYEFEIPQSLVGRLIGTHGAHLNEIRKATNTSIYIKMHPGTKGLKICAVEGTQMEIENALDMIRRKFSKKCYPNLTFAQVVITPGPIMIPIYPENYQLYLIEGINNDVILSSLVSAGHFFLQQPTHPTFPALSLLNSCMSDCYSQPDHPVIPEGVGVGVLCAAPAHDGWYRAQMTEIVEGSDLCTVKFVDYGGYMTMPISSLRQIRADFINLPFQAAECYLADIKPANDEDEWSEEAKECVEKFTYGKVLQAQVHGYAFPGVPLINLYTLVNNEFILLNEELVHRGFAEWVYCEPVTEEVQEDDGAMGCSEMKEPEPVAVPV